MKSFQRPLRKPGPHGRGAFTLLELLLVIVVIAILATLTIMAVGSLGGGRKLTAGGNLAVDLINHARQVAKSKNTLTMVAMIDSGSDSGRALTTLIFSATGGTNGAWSQLDPWRVLPDGVTVDQASSTNFFKALPASATPLKRAGETVDCTGAVFLPDGRALNSSASPQVLFLKHLTSAEPAPSLPNYFKIIVNQATGIPIIRRP
jgi:prepilin-type N-terminal cleavage/methylation domain-containing protein